MRDFLNALSVRAALGFGLVFVLAYFGIRLIVLVRRSITTGDTSQTDLAAEFQEMRGTGDISAEELRNIQAVLGRKRDSS
ncbi:MAG: hypothetical protein KF752_19575 [Pirellulaceae bacterium]|nr:hypothetical protein [Pirellulaceae bacterium]